MMNDGVDSSSLEEPLLLEDGGSDANGAAVELSIEDAIERLGIGKFQNRITVVAGLCFAADAMEILLLSFLSQVLQKEWNLTDAQASAIISSVFVGALCGSLVLGPLADAWGRRPVFCLAASVISIFGLATACAKSYTMLLVILFLVGFGVGGSTIPFDMLSEFLPTSHRGVHLLFIEYFWTAGTLLVPALAYLTLGQHDYNGSWQLFVVLCAIPCLVSAILSFIMVPESPRWLCARGRCEEALVILQNAAKINGHDGNALFPNETILTTQEEHSTLCDLFSPKWKHITLRLWGAWLGFSLLYYGTILTITLIFSSNHNEHNNDDDADFDFSAIFASSSAEVIGLTLIIFMVDRVGRVVPTTACYLLGGMSVFLLCVLDSMGASRIVLLTCSFGARLFLMASTCLTWVSTSEILSTEVRTTGHGAANAIARMGGALSPYLISNGTPIQVVGVIMLCISLVTARFTWKLPETRGVAMGMAAIEDHTRSTDHSADELSLSLTANEVVAAS